MVKIKFKDVYSQIINQNNCLSLQMVLLIHLCFIVNFFFFFFLISFFGCGLFIKMHTYFLCTINITLTVLPPYEVDMAVVLAHTSLFRHPVDTEKH